LHYFARDPIHRVYHHKDLTFRMLYAFNENFVLPLSHDEVVHGKGSLIGKMPGDLWRKFANLRLLYGYMYAQPGKKLLFMGDEFGQYREWNHDVSLDWHLLEHPLHAGLQQWVHDLNRLYRTEPALHIRDFSPLGFEWIDANDSINNVLSFLRRSADEKAPPVLVVCNCSPIPRLNYRLGVPLDGYWDELLNSDSRLYGGSDVGNLGGVEATTTQSHGRPFSIQLTLPPLGVVFLRSRA
jgi:1,4-alpha-glucan branching enzyme